MLAGVRRNSSLYSLEDLKEEKVQLNCTVSYESRNKVINLKKKKKPDEVTNSDLYF